MKKSDIEMRDAFINTLYTLAKRDKRIVFLSDDFGAPSLDRFRKDISGQYLNVGISEQNMISVAAGLSLSGKIVYIYAIAPFATLRCYEQIKIDLCTMNLSVTILGVGAGYAYDTAGPTHHSTEDIAIMRALPNMMILSPSDSVIAAAFANISYNESGPKYVRFDRGKFPLIYDKKENNFLDGLALIKQGVDLHIITTGTMAGQGIEISETLAKYSIDAGVIDLYRLKPLNIELLLSLIKQSRRLVTLEEHVINGGVGSIIAEVLVDAGLCKPLKRFAIQDEKCFIYGERKSLQAYCCLDSERVAKAILKWTW